MSELTSELKDEHKQITQTLQKVQTLGISSAEGKTLLMQAKAHLLAHLKKEDEFLYPVLEEHAKTDPSLKSELEVFAKDMDKISQAALDFFDKYADGGSGIEFAKDFGVLVGTLSSRIRKEELVLYSLYDEVQQAG